MLGGMMGGMGGGGGGGGGSSDTGGIGGMVNAPLSLASHFLRVKAQKKALKAQRKAIQNLKSIDVAEYKKQANLGDKEYYVNRLENLRQSDPDLAAVRSEGVKAIYNSIAGEGAIKGRELTAMIASEAGGMNTQYKSLEQDLIKRAQEHMTLRGSFSPDYQAELIRSGLESAGTTGVGPNRTGALAQMLGKNIGREQVALQAHREASAQGLLGNAQAMRNQRYAAIQGLLPYVQGLPQAQLGQIGMQLATQYGPGGGLSGADTLNMLEQNRQLENQKTMELGGLSAQGELLKGEKWAGAIDIMNRATAGAINSAASMYGMGGGGGQGGAQPLPQMSQPSPQLWNSGTNFSTLNMNPNTTGGAFAAGSSLSRTYPGGNYY